MKRAIALDIGEKRIGVAIESRVGSIACGLTVLDRKADRETLAVIQKIIKKEGVGSVVVGHPIRLNGTAGPAAKAAETFARALQKAVSCPVILWDERLTTVEAERVLLQANTSRKRRKAVIDQMAAQLILQNYLDAKTVQDNAPI